MNTQLLPTPEQCDLLKETLEEMIRLDVDDLDSLREALEAE